MSNDHSGGRGPRAATAVELVKMLVIDDSSIRSIATAMKTHTVNHGLWIAYRRPLIQQRKDIERQLKQRESQLVSDFSKTVSTAAAVTNYAKFDIPVHPDIKRLHKALDECDELLSFISDVNMLFKERADMLTALLKIDHEALVSDAKNTFDLNIELRAASANFDNMVKRFGKPWSTND